MALPTGSSGQSWGTFAPPVSEGAQAVTRSLPVAHVVLYEAPTGLYAECLADFTGIVQSIGISAFTLERATFISANDIQQISWSFNTTNPPGIFDSIFFFPRDQAFFGFDDGTFHFGFIRGYPDPYEVSGTRKGLLITSLSAQPNETVAESPHMTLEPADFDSGLKIIGDLWFASGVVSIKPGLKMIDAAVSGALYTASFLTAVATESLSQLVTRFGTADAPTQSYLGLNALVIDEGFVTINSGGFGPLIRNEQWGGGFSMPTADQVTILGSNKNFLVPSGNFTSLTDTTILTGSLNVFSGSILIQGNGVRLEISGQSASMYINNQPVSVVTVSSVRVNQITNTPELPDGVIYLTPSASTSNLDEAFIRASGSWVKLVSQSFDEIDGGFFGGI